MLQTCWRGTHSDTENNTTDQQTPLSTDPVVHGSGTEGTEEGTALEDGNDVCLDVGKVLGVTVNVHVVQEWLLRNDTTSQTGVISEKNDTKVGSDGEHDWKRSAQIKLESNCVLTCSPVLSVTSQFSLGRVSLGKGSIGILVHGEGILMSLDVPGILFILRPGETKASDADSVDVEHGEEFLLLLVDSCAVLSSNGAYHR
jgi:hypothetical protein